MTDAPEHSIAKAPVLPRAALPSARASLLGLFAGCALGAMIHGGVLESLTPLAQFLGPFGELWTRALEMVVFPLVAASLVASVTTSIKRSVGRMVGILLALFLVSLVLAAVFAMMATLPVLELMPTTTDAPSSAAPRAVVPEAQPETAPPASVGDWLVSLVPRNILQAAGEGNLVQVVFFSLLFGLAVSRLPESPRNRLSLLFSSIVQALLVLVLWILRVTPFAVFLLALSFSRQRGFRGGELLGGYVILVSGVLLALTLLLYPVTVIGGRAKLRDVAASLYPGQIVAVSTRSSLASAPPLLEAALRRLPVSRDILTFSIPFAAATFKLNQTVSGTVKFLFLAHLYAVQFDWRMIAIVIFMNLLLSAGSPGLPGGPGAFRIIPYYTAVGIPVEGIVLVEAVDTIPDIFKTLLNTTGYLMASVLLARLITSREIVAERVSAGSTL